MTPMPPAPGESATGRNAEKRKIINFGPGPAKLPESVLLKAQSEMIEYEHSGISVLEMSHRSPEFTQILKKVEANFRNLMDIPNNYRVLFLQGGGTGQFAAVPLNIRYLSKATPPIASYAVTGSWSKKAMEEGSKFIQTQSCFHMPDKRDFSVPEPADWIVHPDSAYVYYCANETINGIEYKTPPELPVDVPLVGDISSNVMSRRIDVTKHGILFAGAQKNIGAAGLTVAIVRDDLVGHACHNCPSFLDYKSQAGMESVYNTPPCYGIYLTNLVLEWIISIGGMDEIERRNHAKSHMIYDIIDKYPDLYYNPIQREHRSRMNIVWRIGSHEGSEALESEFLGEAKKRGMISLKGHRSVGGLRASLYNAVHEAEVRELANLMEDFAAKQGY